eukprot:3936611-Rhodomonas_salina.1
MIVAMKHEDASRTHIRSDSPALIELESGLVPTCLTSALICWKKTLAREQAGLMGLHRNSTDFGTSTEDASVFAYISLERAYATASDVAAQHPSALTKDILWGSL